MPRTLFVHIGGHKTASTYIQKWCSEQADVLRDRGLIYPATGRDFLFGHHGLVDVACSRDDYSRTMRSLEMELEATQGDVIISSENFEFLQAKEIDVLLSLFDVEEIKVIYYYRNWTPLLYSMWQEDVKHGGSTGYHAFCMPHVVFPFGSKLLNFGLVIDRFVAAVGKTSVLVASYDAVTANGSILKHFLSTIRAGEEFPITVETVNKSFDPFIVECIRALNALAALHGYRRSYLVKHYFLNEALRGSGRDRFDQLSEIMRKYITPTPDFANSFAARSFFGRFLKDYDALMNDDPLVRAQRVNAPSEPASVVDIDYLLDPATPALLASLFTSVESCLQQS